jgi:hypothetical protein
VNRPWRVLSGLAGRPTLEAMPRFGDPRLYSDLPPGQQAVALLVTAAIGLVALVAIVVAVLARVA